jgi:chromosome segregation ATPase
MTRLERFSESPETQEHFHKPLVTHHALIGNAAEKIDVLKKQLEVQEKEIVELRTKSGTRENVFIYPSGLDGEQLIDLVNRRLAELKAKLKSANIQFNALRQDRDEDLKEASRLMKEIREFQAQQKGWIARLTEIVDGYHQQFAAAAQERSAALAVDEKVEELSDEETALAASGTQTREVKSRKPLRKKAA